MIHHLLAISTSKLQSPDGNPKEKQYEENPEVVALQCRVSTNSTLPPPLVAAAGKRSRPDEFVREHWRWAVEAFLNYAFGDNWPGRLALLTRSGEPALYPLNFQAQEIPDFEHEIERLELQSMDSSGKMQLQSKRRLEKEKQRIREKLQEQWTDSERLRAGEVRSFLSEEEEARLTGFWARFEERFGGDWKERLQWEKESGEWRLDGGFAVLHRGLFCQSFVVAPTMVLRRAA